MEDYSMIILINFNSHLQLIFTITQNQQMDLPNRINNTIKILDNIEKSIQFDYHKQFGYLNSSLNLLGAGLTLSSTFKVKDAKMKLINKYWTLEDLLKKLSLDSYNVYVDDAVSLSSSYRLSKGTELEYIEGFYSMISGLINMNKDSDLSFQKRQFDKAFSTTDPYIKASYDKAFNDIKYTISASGLTINNLINLYQTQQLNSLGIVFNDPNQFKAFESFILSYINQSQQYDLSKIQQENKNEIKEALTIHPEDKGKVMSLKVCIIRNIEGFPFPTSHLNENEKVENLIINALGTLNMKEHFGDYFSLDKPNQKNQALKLIKENQLLIFNTEPGISDLQIDYPASRGIIQFDAEGVFAIVNDVDHFRFYLNIEHPDDKFNEYLVNIKKVVNELGKHIKFATSPGLNYLTSIPKYLGTGLVMTIELELSKINKKKLDNFTQLKEYDLNIIEEIKLRITNKITIGKSGNEIISDMIEFCKSFFETDK